MVILAILAGVGLGYIIERGDMCFHSTIRGLFRQPRQIELLRAYLLTLLIATPLVWLMTILGWINPWVAPFAWSANIVGGLIFGIGMVVAATCITGLFYKLGHGMLGTLVALVTWAIGDIVTYIGPLKPLREALNRNPVTTNGEISTLSNIFGPIGPILIIGLGIAIAVWLWQSPRVSRGDYWGWLLLGSAVGLFTSLAWLLADAGNSDYPYGTSGVPASLYLALTQGQTLWSPWITISLVSLIPGALIAAVVSGTLWVRGETLHRYLELAGGGLLMGVGAAISGGCNLGHSLIGVPLLSLGSIATTLSMVAGVWIAHQVGIRLRN
ncbi:MAG: YeeE/YedE family protein [Chloroflexota bacterium]